GVGRTSTSVRNGSGRLQPAKHDRPFGRDRDRVLHVSRAHAVAAADGPAVSVDLVAVLAAGQEPWLDRDDQPGPEPVTAPGWSLVGDVRVLVHGPAYAVTAEIDADAVARGAPGRADGRGDVADAGAGQGRGDARLQGPAGGGDQAGVG